MNLQSELLIEIKSSLEATGLNWLAWNWKFGNYKYKTGIKKNI
ncbi:hypothetical protein [Bacteroides fragilis]|nr:hypothetical protein [Bacteroides fragilis]